MPLDPRIPLMAGHGVTPVDPQAFQRGMASAYQLQGMQQAQQARALELAEAQRQEQERGTLARAFQGAVVTDPATGQTSVDMPAAFSAAYRTSTNPLAVLTAETAYGTSQAESRKSVLEAQKLKLEGLQKQTEVVSGIAQGALQAVAQGADPQVVWQRAVAQVAQAGLPTQNLPPTYDAGLLQQYASSTLKAGEALQAQQKVIDQQLREYELAETQKRTTIEARKAGLEERRVGVQEAREQREGGKPAAAPGQALQDALVARYGTRPRSQGYTQAEMAQGFKDVQEGKVQVSAAQGAEKARLELETKPLEGEAAKAVSELTALQTMTDDVTDLFDPSYTGQWEGRWGAVRQWGGQASQREVVFRRVVQDLKDQLLRARSGAAITQSEYERLSGLVPNVTDADTTFQAKLLGFRRGLDQAKQARLQTATTGRGTLRGQQPGVTPLPGGGAQSPHAGIPVDQLTPAQLAEEKAWLQQQLQGP